jgi:hypothetical protein
MKKQTTLIYKVCPLCRGKKTINDPPLGPSVKLPCPLCHKSGLVLDEWNITFRIGLRVGGKGVVLVS